MLIIKIIFPRIFKSDKVKLINATIGHKKRMPFDILFLCFIAVNYFTESIYSINSHTLAEYPISLSYHETTLTKVEDN